MGCNKTGERKEKAEEREEGEAVEDIPLLTPYKMGGFLLSHRSVTPRTLC